MTAPSPTLFPYEALSLQQICIQPVNGEAIKTFSGALTILSRIFACEEINLYIARPYETGEVLELAERASIFDLYRIEPALGCSIDMSLDAEGGEYDNMSSMLTRIMTDSLLNCLRFSREEMAKSRTLKDLAVRMGLVADRTPESYKELLQRFHVGELKPSLNERLLQSRKEAEAKGKWSFEPVINMPQICSDTSDVPLEDQLVSVFVEDMLEHSLPYIHAVPLFVAVKAYGITCKRVSLLCSIYLENAIYRGKDPSAQSLIPDSEKRYIVGKLKAVLDEIPTLTTLSEQKESTLRGEINRGYYKILSAFISKKDLREFMRLAGERQIVEAEGLPLNREQVEKTTEMPILAIFAMYKQALDEYSKSHKKRHDDALVDRVIVLLQKIDGESASTLHLETKKSRTRPDQDGGKALKEDIPRLLALFPELPPLPNR